MSPEGAGGRLSVDLAALRRNYAALRALAGSADCAAVVKADAYGLGLAEVATALAAEGCRTFFVARAHEGVALRNLIASARIHVLDGASDDSLSALRFNGLIPVLNSIYQLGLWREAGAGEPCTIHVDTGMNRLGLRPDEFEMLVADGALDGLNVAMVMTHPACADEPTDPMNAAQVDAFARVRALLPDVAHSYCNSAALLAGGDTLRCVRPGIALYGGEAVNGRPPLEVVARLHARIVQRRMVPEGETVGYGATWRAERDTELAVCAVGYADGFPRASGTGAPVRASVPGAGYGALDGVRVPIVGRVSMDLTTFDVTGVSADVLREHDHVELFGDTISLDEAARAAGTIGYEMLTSLGRRYERSYIGA